MENSETKKDKFHRLAEQRINSILDKLRLLGNLSNISNYSYNEEEIRKIFTVIEAQVKHAKEKFRFPTKKFKL